MTGRVVSAWTDETCFVSVELTHLALSRSLSRSMFSVFMPLLLPTPAAEGTWGACSQSVAWRFLDQASGTVEKERTKWKDGTGRKFQEEPRFSKTSKVSWGAQGAAACDEKKKEDKEKCHCDTHPAHEAGEDECSLGCRLLVVALGLLHLCLLLGIFLLTLNLLMPARHSGKTWGETGEGKWPCVSW